MDIAEMNLFGGQMETISLSELRANPGEVFLHVQMGKSFTVTKNGKSIALISKPEPTALEFGAEIRRLKLV